jgi:hypothetical protein
LRNKWQKNIKRGESAKSVKLVELDKAKHRVCELHFTSNDIIKPASAYIDCQETMERKKRKRQHILLKKDAVPTIFPNYPAHLQPKVFFHKYSQK